MRSRKAGISDFEKVRAFYWNVIDAMKGKRYDPGWEKGVYPADEALYIHALGVEPSKQGQGIGRQLVRDALEAAKGIGNRAVRLDVLGGNEPARRLYEGAGFELRARENMYYEDTGWKDFYIYELIL